MLADGARIDSIPLGYTPRGVAVDGFGRVYALGLGASERPFVEVFERPGYRRIGRMQAPAGVRACAFQCSDGVIGFDLLLWRVYVVDAADPSFVGSTGNGIWTFRMPIGAPPATAKVRLR